MWLMTPETNGFPHHLIHVPLKDSPLSDCGGMCGDLDIQIKLEDNVRFLLVDRRLIHVTACEVSHLMYLYEICRGCLQTFLW